MKRFTTLTALIAFVAVSMVASSAFAVDETDTMAVSATVVASCSVLAADLAFGNYDPVEGADVTGTASVTVTCSTGAPWSVALNAGQAASFAPRRMASGANSLDYNLFTAADHATVWGSSTLPTVVVSGTGNGSAQLQTVYGKIPALQTTVPTGIYADTITATITY